MASVIICEETKHFLNKTKLSSFTLIENYQKDVNETCTDDDDNSMTGLDQEVPLSPFCDIKPQINQESLTNERFEDVFTAPFRSNYYTNMCIDGPCISSSDSVLASFYEDGISSSDSGPSLHSSSTSLPTFPSALESQRLPMVSSSSSSLPSSQSQFLSSAPPSTIESSTFRKQQPSAVRVQGSSSFSSSLPSSSSSSSSFSTYSISPVSSSFVFPSTPMSSPSSSLSSSASSISSLSPMVTAVVNKEETFVSEMGQNGCTVVTNMPNFLSQPYSDLVVPSRNQDDFPEYTDLDKLPELSFYDELISANPKYNVSINNLKDALFTCDNSNAATTNDVPLEAVVELMREALEQDRRKLCLAHDPHTWTSMDVCRWVKWVCEKNKASDISSYLSELNGATLCSWNSEAFDMQFGVPGSCLFEELELWKTASNYKISSQMSRDQDMTPSTNLPYFEMSQASLTPSTSPAPSHSSNSQSLYNSTMDSSEDEVFYPESDKKPVVTKISTIRRPPFKPLSGRGHKKAITLWQFLLDLLVGKEDRSDCIRWLNQESRIFKIEDSKKVATLWGKVKSRPAMNYDKLSRSVRQYYKKGIIKKPEQTKRLVYQFCPGIC